MKLKILMAAVILVASFGIGRYTAKPDERVVVQTKIEKQIVKEEVVHTVTKVVEKPDGTKETTIVQDSETNTNTNIQKEQSKDVTVGNNRLNISMLAGAQPHLFQGVSLGPIVYGAAISKPIIGPITIGAWGLSDLTVGVSLGMNF